MKPYYELSRNGKLRRLRQLAMAAVSAYDLRNPCIVYHGFETNLLYRIVTASSERYILRLATPGWRALEDLQSEALWLDAIARDTSIQAPTVVRNRNGLAVHATRVPGIPDTWNATLMTWLPGRLLGHYLNKRNLAKMGSLFAELHFHGATWTRPAGFTTRRFVHWLSRGEPNLLIEKAAGSSVGTDAIETILRMHRHVVAAYAAMDSKDLRVIHCDLWHDNIKLHNGVLHPFDFEDTVLGYRAHDIAMAMLDLLEDTDEEHYPGLLRAFRAGYETGLAWPDERIEPFQIGRLLWKLNWIAEHQPNWFTAAVERYLPVFETYERTGRVVQPPKPGQAA